MISIRADVLARAVQGLNRRKSALVDTANKAYRKKVFAIFQDLLQVWSQFSGDMVSNWQIVTSPSQEKPYKVWPEKLAAQEPATMGADGRVERHFVPHQAGDPDAVNFAFTRAKFVQFTYKDKVHFVNMTPLHVGDGTVSDMEGVTHDLRPANTQIISNFDLISSYLKAKHGA